MSTPLHRVFPEACFGQHDAAAPRLRSVLMNAHLPGARPIPPPTRGSFESMVPSLSNTIRRGSLRRALASAAVAGALAAAPWPAPALAPQAAPNGRPTTLLQHAQHYFTQNYNARPRYYAPPTIPPSYYRRWASPPPPAYFAPPPPTPWLSQPAPPPSPFLGYDRY